MKTSQETRGRNADKYYEVLRLEKWKEQVNENTHIDRQAFIRCGGAFNSRAAAHRFVGNADSKEYRIQGISIKKKFMKCGFNFDLNRRDEKPGDNPKRP